MNGTPLDQARAVAISYRNALHGADPTLCAFLDEKAVEMGHGWVAPIQLPEFADDPLVMDAELSAVDIEHWWRISASTIRTWANRGLVEKRCAADGSPVYQVREVLNAQARTQRKATT